MHLQVRCNIYILPKKNLPLIDRFFNTERLPSKDYEYLSFDKGYPMLGINNNNLNDVDLLKTWLITMS